MIKFEVIEGFPSGHLSELCSLLPGFKEENFIAQFEHRKKILCCFAWDSSKLVGCKIGYEDRPGYFLSAAGGLKPKYRKQGIVSKLMELQHEWCKENGFGFINAYTGGNNTPMLMFSLKAGFEICGFQVDRYEIYNVAFQSKLGQ